MADFGTITVRVFTTEAQIPVVGATVVITKDGKEGKYELLSVQTTNSSGEIVPVKVETPPAVESMNPFLGEEPYQSCSIWAEHPGFAMMMIEGVQVFSGITTIQNIPLSPLPAGGSSLRSGNREVIPSQEL